MILFSKPALPGYVKTRLIGKLSPQEAADLHAAFLEDLSSRLKQGEFDLVVAWALETGMKPPNLGIRSIEQVGETLGDRLFSTLSELGKQYPYVAAIGSDHPDLPLLRVHEAFDKLEAGADVAVGPADDGGYYLIAMRDRAIRWEIFEGVEWSSPTVLESTRDNCKALGLRLDDLAVGFDVDTDADLDRLKERLHNDPSIECSSTRAFLARWESDRNESEEQS